MITISQWTVKVQKSDLGLVILDKFDHINWVITLSIIPLSSNHLSSLERIHFEIQIMLQIKLQIWKYFLFAAEFPGISLSLWKINKKIWEFWELNNFCLSSFSICPSYDLQCLMGWKLLLNKQFWNWNFTGKNKKEKLRKYKLVFSETQFAYSK